MLYIVSTPIGNLKDITLRALEVLKSVDLIACEDTRRTKILLDRYQIKKPLISYYSYNKIQRAEKILESLKQNKSVALVSEAGTPGVSDPGTHLINMAIENKIPFTIIPGPVALIAGLVLSGFDSNRFVFEGFLPVKSGARRKKLEELAGQKRTVVLYEAPHRIIKLLQEILEVFGDREIACARELTKKFEEVKRDKTSALLAHFKSTKPRGEFVVIVPSK